MIGEQIKNLEGAVERENPTREEVATWKNRHTKLLGNVEEELNQLHLQWVGSDAANRDAIANTVRTSTIKFLSDLGKIEMNIARKTLPDPTPPAPTNFSNTSQKQALAFKKRELPRFSGEATDYPRFKKL